MKLLHKSNYGTRFHIPKKQPIRNKVVVKVTRQGGLTEEQFANDVMEFTLQKNHTINGKIELRVVG